MVDGDNEAACQPRLEFLAYASNRISHAVANLTARHDSLLLSSRTAAHATTITSGELHTKPRHLLR